MANSIPAKAVPKPRGEGIFARIGKFIRESYVETRYKSAWPTWAELRSFTLVVIFALVVVSVWIGGLDYMFGRITDRLGK